MQLQKIFTVIVYYATYPFELILCISVSTSEAITRSDATIQTGKQPEGRWHLRIFEDMLI